MTEGYEVLRAQATGTGDGVASAVAGSSSGLALLLRSGLGGWMAAWHSLVVAAPPTGVTRTEGRDRPVATGRLGADLATLLAEMAVAGQRRTRP